MQNAVIGIMGAMPEEIDGLLPFLENQKEMQLGLRTYYTGILYGMDVVIVVSGWGKVAAASTASTLVLRFGISKLIFTGVAGAISPKLRIGDIVLGTRLMQHDMDARPFIKRFEIPLLGRIYFESPEEQLRVAKHAIQTLLNEKHLHAVINEQELSRFGISQPVLVMGDIASGDQFFSSNEEKGKLATALPETLCVEMEGAAVAQICFENSIPFTIIRTISDAADDHSVADFQGFINHVSSRYSVEIIRNILTSSYV